MSRILLIHWNLAEAEERAAVLSRAGHQVERRADQGSAWLREVAESPPDAFVIDLRRLPSQGQAVGVFFRQRTRTRYVPIVFVEGDPEKTARVRSVLPDATYAAWSRIRGALREALRRPPASPVVPGTMDSYSGTPLPRKLGLRAGSAVTILGAPPGFESILQPVPEGARLRRDARGSADIVLLFAESAREMDRRFALAVKLLPPNGKLWIVWPKRTSGVPSDLSEREVRAYGLAAGWVDYKISAIDATWSGLCFGRRRAAGRA